MADITHGTWIKDGKAVDAAYQDGVKVYSRNLLLQTADNVTTVGNNTVGQKLADYRLSAQFCSLPVGTQVTLSFNVDVTNADSGVIYIGFSVPRWLPFVYRIAFSEGHNRFYYTFDLISDYLSDNIIHLSLDNSKAKYVVSSVKLETGNAATTYSAAPEDVM